MRSIPVIGILTLIKYDLLTRLINSIDHDVDNVVILFQGGHNNNFDFSKIKNKFIKNLIIVRSNFNIGVSRGWNYILQNYLKTYCIISGDDNYFNPGSLKKVSEYMTPDKLNEVMFAARGDQAFTTYIFTKKTIETIGYFDENIYPAYYEDNDYRYRMLLSGHDFISIPDILSINTGDDNHRESCTLHSADENYRNKMSECFSRNGQYFESKWGNSTYKFPFDRKDLTINSIINHENFIKNQKILLNHTKDQSFNITTVSMSNLLQFNWVYYKEKYEDMTLNNILSEKDLLNHYVDYGIKENREIRDEFDYNFDWKRYISNYEDLRNAGIDNKEKAWKHWVEFGKNEGRKFI